MKNPRGVLEDYLTLVTLAASLGESKNGSSEDAVNGIKAHLCLRFADILHAPDLKPRAYEYAQKIENIKMKDWIFAHLFWEGIGVEKNRQRAKELILASAERGVPHAAYLAAVVVELPRGPEGRAAARSWLLQENSASAFTLLAQLYLEENLDAQAAILLEIAVERFQEEKTKRAEEIQNRGKFFELKYLGGGMGQVEGNFGLDTAWFSDSEPLPEKSEPGFHDFSRVDEFPTFKACYVIEPADAPLLLADCYRDARGVLADPLKEKELRELGQKWQREKRNP